MEKDLTLLRQIMIQHHPYIKLDKSPVPMVTGTYASTEKAQLHDLTDAVTEIGAAVSMLTAKKAVKDAPVWIYPTLVNGWEIFGFNIRKWNFLKMLWVSYVYKALLNHE